FIVKKIFDMAIKGNSTYFIAKYLNTNKYSNPTRYYKTGEIYRNNEEYQWSASKVKAILKNEVYIGNLIQGVYQQDLTKGKKRYKADISELIIFENAHEGIISKEKFETIKSNRGSNLIKKKFLNLPSESIFKGIVYEKETNKLLNIHRKIYRNNSNKFKFIFINNIYPEKIESKTKIYFDEKFLINHILNILNEFISNIKDRDLFIKKINYKFYYLRKTIKANLNKLNKNLIETKESIRNKYIQYTNNGIKLEEYINFKNLQKNRLKNIENEITLNSIKNNNILKYHQTLLEFLRIILKDNTELILNKELLSLFIEKILVNRDKTIELKFKINFEKLIQIQ
ncbi:MAG TPA: recombinase family protein, partial [Candidatus Dwaynia gallinarum]|nr:recombinase family protein [Candidatus Dwaynia gallinarum]